MYAHEVKGSSGGILYSDESNSISISNSTFEDVEVLSQGGLFLLY